MTHFSDLSPSEQDKVRTLSYEYIFYLASKWYLAVNTKDFKDFKEHNELTTSKLLLYPFYYSTANGCSKDLYAIMKPFYAREDGPIPEILENIVLDNANQLDFFITDFQENNAYGLGVNDNNIDNVETIKDKILNSIIKLGDGTKINFENVIVKTDKEDDAKQLYKALESSDISLRTQSNNKFIEYDTDTLSIISHQYQSYRDFYTHKPSEQILYEEVKKDSKIYT